MSTILKSLIGSFLGKIIASIFIAICIFIGFGPDEWAQYIMSGLPNYFSPKITRYCLLTFASITLFILCFNQISALCHKLIGLVKQKISYIKWIDGPHSIHTFGYVISRPHKLALVDHIRLKGINNRKSSLIVKSAYLRSLVTGERILAKINNIEAQDLEIRKSAFFTIIFSLPNDDGSLANDSIKGLTFNNFLKRFSNFEIIIKTDKKELIIEFESKETKEWVTNVQSGLMTQQPSEKAAVLKLS
jgi:hypothetical protein